MKHQVQVKPEPGNSELQEDYNSQQQSYYFLVNMFVGFTFFPFEQNNFLCSQAYVIFYE